MAGELITGTSFLLSGMAFYILFEMIRINKILDSIEITKLMVIPLILGVFYMYLSVYNPDIETARMWSRFCMFTSLSIALQTVYSYSRKIRAKGGKQ